MIRARLAYRYTDTPTLNVTLRGKKPMSPVFGERRRGFIRVKGVTVSGLVIADPGIHGHDFVFYPEGKNAPLTSYLRAAA